MSDVPLLQLRFGLRASFREIVTSPDAPTTRRSGRIVDAKLWVVEVDVPLDAPAGRFVFYIWNASEHFVTVQAHPEATARVVGEPKPRDVQLEQPQGLSGQVPEWMLTPHE